jgi:hypothetical protein
MGLTQDYSWVAMDETTSKKEEDIKFLAPSVSHSTKAMFIIKVSVSANEEINRRIKCSKLYSVETLFLLTLHLQYNFMYTDYSSSHFSTMST